MYLEELDRYENGLIEKFRSHPVFTNIKTLSDSEFKNMLVQKRFISLSFTPLYDCAIDAIEDKEGKTLLRQLLREEYPKGQSHRENLVTDLIKIGITKKEILETEPTKETIEAIKSLFALLKFQDFHDIKILVSLRMAEELLVAEEYSFILAELKSRYNIHINDSIFYGPHYMHDRKQKPFGVSGESHADEFNKILAAIINMEEKCAAAKHAIAAACEARMKFFDQFVK